MADILAPQFQDADKAREYLEALRWPDGQVCPHCGSVSEHYALQGKTTRPGLWKCKDCRKQFTVIVGTVFSDSKVPLNKWLLVAHLMCASKKAVSAHQIHRMIGVTYKTAWFMCHRVREAMKSAGGLLGSGGGTVEADETYWGNKGKQRKGARGYDHKMKIVSLVERGGTKRSIIVSAVNQKTIRRVLEDERVQVSALDDRRTRRIQEGRRGIRQPRRNDTQPRRLCARQHSLQHGRVQLQPAQARPCWHVPPCRRAAPTPLHHGVRLPLEPPQRV